MPLDGHDFLVSQGWSGKGTGLRQGAISRPIAIPQKKNLAGLGKDRDEAFPFWDHLFAAASKSIKLNLSSDDELDEETSPLPEIKRTATGIMSNRRPLTGASATTSGTSTPDANDGNPRLTLIATAKRDAARARLYARFFRGPVLGPDDALPTALVEPPPGDIKDKTNQASVKTNDKKSKGGDEDVEPSTKKRKRDPGDVAARTQRKKERKEQKAKEKEERRARRRGQRANYEVASKVVSEDVREKEKKRRKRESKEKEKSKDDRGADQVLRKGKKKAKSQRQDDVTAADIIIHEETALKDGQGAPVNKSTGILDPEVSELTTRKREKKKRKREEA
ncbi:hypothetical protein C0995_003259 [Termitomyces sp. Mi166|nr:hypothetical protein C0995_003259 [Termitomyces sp. Mi166\